MGICVSPFDVLELFIAIQVRDRQLASVPPNFHILFFSDSFHVLVGIVLGPPRIGWPVFFAWLWLHILHDI